MQPKIQISVDEGTGVWSTDGFPMVYVPRHFMVNIHKAQESAFGREALKAVLDEGGSKSAYYWCEKSAGQSNLGGAEVFAHYLDRLTARGWGIFRIEELDEVAGTATISLENSIYVLETPNGSERPVCYMFEGFFEGGFQYLLDSLGGPSRRARCEETACAAAGAPVCTFKITSA